MISKNTLKDFQNIADILKQLKGFITQKTNTFWTGFESANAFLEELNRDIERIEACDFEALEKVMIEFAPTGTYQELSLSNGWSDDYIKLANKFDKLYNRLTA